MVYIEISGTRGTNGENCAWRRSPLPTVGNVPRQGPGPRGRFDLSSPAVESSWPALAQPLQARTEVLALVGLAAAIVDRECHVLAANSLLAAMADHVRWHPNGQLFLVDQPSNVRLRQALTTVLSTGGTVPCAIASRSSTGKPTIVRVLRAWGQSREAFEVGLAMLLVAPVTTPRVPEATMIRDLFDLSASEARVACAIAGGETVNQIAARTGVSRETVRTQLKSVMAKTGTRRQAETAILLAGLSLGLQGQSRTSDAFTPVQSPTARSLVAVGTSLRHPIG